MIRQGIKIGENVMIGLVALLFSVLCLLFCVFFFKKVVLSDD